MENTITSREAILKICMDIAKTKGLQGINMRTVAKTSNISVGSIYNYFPSKTDLIMATIEGIWADIFNIQGNLDHPDDFILTLHWLFEGLRTGADKYPGFFNYHALSFGAKDRPEGKRAMDRYFGHLTDRLLTALKLDKKVRPDAFNESFTEAGFVDLIFNMFISSALRGNLDDSYILEVTKRAIY